MATRAVRTSPHAFQDTQLRSPYSPNQSTPLSRSYAYKKVTKPLLERRRRARISKCLEELKDILVGRMGISEESLNRLEKADILEMAVQHLQDMQTNSCLHRYQEGFNECAATAFHFLETSTEFDEGLSERLVDHLETCTGPLTIDVPRYHLTFSPPVSPISLGTSPKPFEQLSLSEFSASGGLLMEVQNQTSRLPRKPKSKNVEHSGSPTTRGADKAEICSTGGKRKCSLSTIEPPKKLFLSRNIDLSGICTPPAEEKDSMWRPW